MDVIQQILLFLGVLVFISFLIKWSRKNANSTKSQPPSLPCLPLVGSLPFIRNFSNVPLFFMNKARELGPIFTLRIGNRLVVTLNSKDAIVKAYVGNSLAFTGRGESVLNELVNPDNKGIAFKRKAGDWKKPQQLSLSILKEFGFGVKGIMETRIFEEVEAMTEYVQKKNGNPFDPTEMFTLATFNIIINILFGHRRDYDMGQSELSIQMHRYMFNFSNVYDIIPFLKFIPSYRQQLNSVVEGSKVIIKCIEMEIQQSLQQVDNPGFVQSYIKREGPDYDRAELKYILRDLVVGGTDTSSTTLRWGFLALANNPDIQKRLHTEIDAELPGDRLPTLQDEARLPYVEATILEITRWRTMGPLSLPRETSRDCVVNGFFIPGKTLVIANLYAVHGDSNVWKDPEVFRPERFLDGENRVVGKDKLIPFSVGRRSCPGEALARAELFLIFTSLVKRFLILPPEGQDKINDDPRSPVSLIMQPMPFKIRLIRRE